MKKQIQAQHKLLLIIVSLLMALLLAACGSTQSEQVTAVETVTVEVEKEATVEEVIVLEWWDYYSNETSNAATEDMIARLEAALPHIKIERTSLSSGDLRPKLSRQPPPILCPILSSSTTRIISPWPTRARLKTLPRW